MALGNPPYYSHYAIAELFLQTALKGLKPGGRVQIVTKQGYLVMGQGGAIQFDPNNSVAITVAPDGTISQGSQVRGKLNVVGFNDPNLLKPVGDGFYHATDPNLVTGESDSMVRQGFLEEARKKPQRFRVIDASQPPESVHAQILAAVKPLLPGRAE